MSPEIFRKVKAIMLIALLTVAEGHRVQVQAGASNWGKSQAGSDALSGAVPRVRLFPQKESTRVAKQMTATIDNMWTHASEKIGAMLSDPNVQERGNLVLQMVEALMGDLALHEQAAYLAELTGAINENPSKQDVAAYVAKHLEVMMTDPNFQGQVETIAGQLEADQDVHEQLSTMMYLEKLVLEMTEAMKAEPSALIEVTKSSVKESSQSVLVPLQNVLRRVRAPRPGKPTLESGAHPAEPLGRVPLSDLSTQTLGLRGHNQNFREPSMSTNSDTVLDKLAKDWTRGRGQPAAKTSDASQFFFGALGAIGVSYTALADAFQLPSNLGPRPRGALGKDAAAVTAAALLFHSEAAKALGLPSAVNQMSETLAGVVAVDGGTIGLDVSFAAFLAVILGLFIPVVFLVTVYIQSDAQGTATTFRQPDSIGGTRYEDE